MSDKKGQKVQGKSYYGFDSTGLEKAAAAAKYLDDSKNANHAFELAAKSEESKQLNRSSLLKPKWNYIINIY